MRPAGRRIGARKRFPTSCQVPRRGSVHSDQCAAGCHGSWPKHGRSALGRAMPAELVFNRSGVHPRPGQAIGRTAALSTRFLRFRPLPALLHSAIKPDLSNRRTPTASQGTTLAPFSSWSQSLSSPWGWREIERTPHGQPTAVQHVRVDHGRAHVAMPEKLLNRADIVPALKQVRRERVP